MKLACGAICIAILFMAMATDASHVRQKRQFMDNTQVQKNQQIPFYIDPKVRGVPQLINALNAGRQLLETNTCIRMVEKSQWDGNEHTVTNTYNETTKCAASIGAARYYSDFNFTIEIGPECWDTPISILHELFHTLNINHPHSYSDSQQNFINVRKGKYAVKRVVPFDPSTIVSYGQETRDTRYMNVRAQRAQVPFYDYLAVNTYYNCTNKCDSYPKDFCKNGGYRHPNNCNVCICPYGFAGSTCEELPFGCGRVLTATTSYQTANLMNKTAVDQECYWWIQAPAGKKIDWNFKNSPTYGNIAFNSIYIFGHEDIRMSPFILYHNLHYAGNHFPVNMYQDIYPGNILRIKTKYLNSWASEMSANLTFRYV